MMKVMMMVVVMVAMMVCEWCVMMMTMVMSESHVRAVRVSLDGHNCAAHPHRYRQGTTHCDLCPSAGLGHSLATERGAEWVSHDGHTRRDADTHTHVSTWRSGNCDSGGRETAVGDMARSESLGAMASCKWWCPALIVCIYGFVSQLRPAESFLMPFLLSPDKNLTREQITNEVMPVLVYSYMAVLVPVFLLSDLLRYKPMLVLQSASLVAVWLLLLFTRGILGIQFVEFFYGVSMAARVAFSPILFALVETGHVQRVTSVSRAATLLGLFGSSALGQLCVTVWGVSYATLNRVSLGFVSVSFLFSLFLPWPRRSLFFHRPPPGDVAAVAAADGRCPERGPLAKGDADAARGGGFGVAAPAAGSAVSAGRAAAATYLEWLRRAGRAVASSPSLCSWCAWWVFGMAGYYMVLYYVQLLWDEVEPSRDNPRVYNGATEATSTLLSESSFLTPRAEARAGQGPCRRLGADLGAWPCPARRQPSSPPRDEPRGSPSAPRPGALRAANSPRCGATAGGGVCRSAPCAVSCGEADRGGAGQSGLGTDRSLPPDRQMPMSVTGPGFCCDVHRRTHPDDTCGTRSLARPNDVRFRFQVYFEVPCEPRSS
ncbi:uncharacterized protein LOC133356811 isoform X3 [Lethenteron reissneri]|uniref:uncharacterized protein LOC133356811 isoform X3 n=1 Tax=Lethenteron reissneri TaxID=7753 RepID=UPI002AB6C2CB|nr:uncharacterized protein LOC133356811 isoform X3 [Lethenteron reissneri]